MFPQEIPLAPPRFAIHSVCVIQLKPEGQFCTGNVTAGVGVNLPNTVVGVGLLTVGTTEVQMSDVGEVEQYENDDPVDLKQYGAEDAHSDEFAHT